MSAPFRIALFGGTFDPIHEGHLEIAEKAHTALSLDQVLFLPCRRSPHKKSGPLASDEDRLQMIKLATQELDWASVSDFELQLPLPSYTWQTVEALKPTLPPKAQLFLLIGLDQWQSLPRWTHPEKLAAALELIVVGRDGEPGSRLGYRSHFLPGNHPASASEIRKDLAENKRPHWLPRKVFNFISKKDLYKSDP